jgi:hypothetical protein
MELKQEVIPMWQEVCDLPYYTEPKLFYETRIRKGMVIGELRRYASSLFGKAKQELTVRDLKLAFLHKFPFCILIDGNDHEVTVKKYNGEWILSCDCKSWIFNRNGRKCKHTQQMEKILGERG